MLLDEIKKKAQDFYNKKIAIKQKTKTTGETYLVKNNASEENIDTLKKMSKLEGISIDNIRYTSSTGEKMTFSSPEELESYLNKDDRHDLSLIEDGTKELTTVYGDYQNRNTNACPHCGHIFDEPPTRGRKCPECGNQFYVRSNNRLFASDLLKPQDAIAADCFSHMLNMPDFDITVDFARNILESRRKSFPVEPASRDVIWDIMRRFPDTLSNDPLRMVKAVERLEHLVAIYENDCGRDPRSLLESSVENNIAYCKLMIMLNNPGQDYLYVSSNSCCEICRSRYGKKIKIKDAEEKMPIPFKDCQNKLHPKDKYNFCLAKYTWSEPPIL